MVWDLDMSNEQDSPQKKEILSEGEHKLKITGVELITGEESKSGNPYFIWELTDENGNIVDVGGCKVVRKNEEIIFKGMITTLKKGCRWLLKQTLEACNIFAQTDDPNKKYSFAPENVIGKWIIGVVKHEDSSFTGRNGNLITTKKAKICGVKGIEPTKKQKTLPKIKTEKNSEMLITGENEENPDMMEELPF